MKATIFYVALAAQYPTKTVRVIVPQAPAGGGIDFMARQYAVRLSDSLATLYRKLSFDTVADLTGVSLLATTPNVPS